MDYAKMNRGQLAAATYEGKYLLVLAGAGTGKTRTIVARAVHLLDSGVSPERIKLLAFTKKAANEIVERIRTEASDDEAAKNLSGATFHSWCMSLIRKYPEFGLLNCTCIDEDDRLSAFRLVMGRIYGVKKVALNEYGDVSAEAVAGVCSYAFNALCGFDMAICKLMGLPRDASCLPEIRKVCDAVIREYFHYKRDHDYIDYDDMLARVEFALRKNDALREKVAGAFSDILVDEAQDTNPLQWRLLDAFRARCRIFCVGDDAQSIYAFRGADFDAVHSFTERMHGGEVAKLTVNYRSSQEILNVANWLLAQSPLAYGKALTADRGHGRLPDLYVPGTDWEEARTVTRLIREGVAGGKRFCDYLVLARSFYELRKVESSCLSMGIPYVAYGGTQLMRSAHVRDVVSALRIWANPHDELAWTRYLTLWPGVGDVKAAEIVGKVMACAGYFEAVEAVDPAADRTGLMKALLASLAGFTGDPAGAMEMAVEMLEPLLSQKYKDWPRRKGDFEALEQVARQCRTVARFVEEFAVDPAADLTLRLAEDGPQDTVILSTIHSAKGLEADTCIVVNVTPGHLPSSRAVTQDEIEEERRCLYVAVTRAKNRLVIFSRKDPESKGFAAGGFLDGLPAGLVHVVGADRAPVSLTTST